MRTLLSSMVFTRQKSVRLFDKTTAIGYVPALVGGQQVRKADQRNNFRCIIDDANMGQELFTRLKQYIPTTWLQTSVAGVNERMRFLKYHPGEYFKPHNDGIYVRPDGSESTFVTIQLYLNTVPEGDGGEPIFTTERKTYGNNSGNKDDSPIRRLAVRPVTGRVLIFEHHLLHEGAKLLNGVKYTLRTDVLYKTQGRGELRKPRWGIKIAHPQYTLL